MVAAVSLVIVWRLCQPYVPVTKADRIKTNVKNKLIMR